MVFLTLTVCLAIYPPGGKPGSCRNLVVQTFASRADCRRLAEPAIKEVLAEFSQYRVTRWSCNGVFTPHKGAR
jgi:hypothetical protein